MKRLVLIGALVSAVGVGSAIAQTPSGGAQNRAAALGTVTLNKRVMADGKPLAPGTYQVRLSNEDVKPAAGQAPDSEKWVEFVRGGKVAGREVATVVSADDIGKIAKGKRPRANGSTVEMLKGGDYWRVWINRSGTNYIINLPPAA
jgi:hypothetical protein